MSLHEDIVVEMHRLVDQADADKRVRGNVLERFRVDHRDKPVKVLQARHIDRWMTDKAEAPLAANDLRKMLNQLMTHAILLGLRETNPVDATEAIRTDSEGYHCWTEEEFAAFDDRWALGTRERLAKELLLYTALRRSDIVRVGGQNRDGDSLVLRHTKNRSETVIPILAPLARALDAIDVQHLTYLVTAFGKPFTAAGFGNWFGERCTMAGIPHCSAHGLRKAMARRLADAGVTTLDGRAVMGHKSNAMFAHYAAKASGKVQVQRALKIVSDALGLENPVGKQINGGNENG
ncbi:MAG TPA: tyrosine-type recombinase/integrase [Sphingobium sp.]|uniref:tyrosine-type recombinase/integrase n=1 Tax=Sphingobium sp. TaxID=1912891 RepID=UPI002ED27D46